jgi:hypothetical protein
MPSAPPPTPASPTFAGATADHHFGQSLEHALSSVIVAADEQAPAVESTPKADLGAELARAMEDLVVAPMCVTPTVGISDTPQGKNMEAEYARTIGDALAASVDMHDEDEEADGQYDDEPFPIDEDESEDTSEGGGENYAHSRMKMSGMLPAGACERAWRGLAWRRDHVCAHRPSCVPPCRAALTSALPPFPRPASRRFHPFARRAERSDACHLRVARGRERRLAGRCHARARPLPRGRARGEYVLGVAHPLWRRRVRDCAASGRVLDAWNTVRDLLRHPARSDGPHLVSGVM